MNNVFLICPFGDMNERINRHTDRVGFRVKEIFPCQFTMTKNKIAPSGRQLLVDMLEHCHNKPTN